jgi:aspartyl-tRNA(Asn)/glutamyl-tRNA(Gln) amidotransferase subunit C
MIDEEDLKHIARLAKIELNEEEVKEFSPQIRSILALFDEIDEVETEDVEPTFHVFGLKNVFREDVSDPSLTGEEAVKNAPKKERGYVKGPRIM